MEEAKNETQVEEEIGEETPEDQLTPETDWEAEAKKARGIAQRALTKLKKLGETKPPQEKAPEPVKSEPKAGELDNNALDYLDLKGITEQEDIDVIQKVIQRTGQTIREVLKDDYVAAKLKSNQDARAVQAATPSGTKRSAGTSDNLEAAIAKFERTNELPTDFAQRSAVVNAIVERSNPNIPAYKKR